MTITNSDQAARTGKPDPFVSCVVFGKTHWADRFRPCGFPRIKVVNFTGFPLPNEELIREFARDVAGRCDPDIRLTVLIESRHTASDLLHLPNGLWRNGAQVLKVLKRRIPVHAMKRR